MPQSATATVNLTPGVAGPTTITTTVPTFGVSPWGTTFTLGTGEGQYQVLNVDVQFVKKTAGDPNQSFTGAWFWYSPNSTPFVTANAICTDADRCSKSGFFQLDITRSGSPVTYTPSYFYAGNDVANTGNNRVSISLTPSSSSPLPGSITGLQPGDTFSLTLKDGLLTFPADLADYEFRFVYRVIQLVSSGSGSNGPIGVATSTSAGPATLSTAVAPTAVALAGAARVTPDPVSPTPAKFIITASPQVGGVTKTCTVTPPATNCNVTGLTAGQNYTFTTQVIPLGGIGSAQSPASSPVTPFEVATVTSISPSLGSVAGGETVTITGTGFQSGATVSIGSSCTSVNVVSSTQITCVTGARSASVNGVTVTNPSASGVTLSSAYRYVVKPSITSVDMTSGPATGGTSINIVGTGFVVSGLSVRVGGQPCVISSSSTSSVTCTTSAATAGAADIVLTNSDGGSDTELSAFTFVAAPTTSASSLAMTGLNPAPTLSFGAISALLGVVFLLLANYLGLATNRRKTYIGKHR